jgi:hypothetical protein
MQSRFAPGAGVGLLTKTFDTSCGSITAVHPVAWTTAINPGQQNGEKAIRRAAGQGRFGAVAVGYFPERATQRLVDVDSADLGNTFWFNRF